MKAGPVGHVDINIDDITDVGVDVGVGVGIGMT